MAITLTNRIASQAINGDGAIVSLDSTDQAKLVNVTLRQNASCGSSSKLGTVARIDLLGNTIVIIPATNVVRFDSSSTPGFLAVGETITLT